MRSFIKKVLIICVVAKSTHGKTTTSGGAIPLHGTSSDGAIQGEKNSAESKPPVRSFMRNGRP